MLYVCSIYLVGGSIGLWTLLLFASIKDIQTRTYPNRLAVAVLVVCVSLALSCAWLDCYFARAVAGGLIEAVLRCFCLSSRVCITQSVMANVATRIAVAVGTLGVLLGSEMLQRMIVGRPGLGMGDVKCVASVALVYPWALLAFCLGCVALAFVGLVLRVRTLPALPFFTCFLFVLTLVSAVCL